VSWPASTRYASWPGSASCSSFTTWATGRSGPAERPGSGTGPTRNGAWSGKAPTRGGAAPDAARFLTAEGRDVALRETRLDDDQGTRRLTVAGGTRTEHAATKPHATVLQLVTADPGLTMRSFEAAIPAGVPRKPARDALAALITAGKIHTAQGPRGARMHFPDDGCDRPRDCRSAEGRR
jgi:hypothetical protein